MPDERDFPDERWAARLGRVGSGLWQLETLQKYGYYQQSHGMAVVGVQAGYGYLLSRGHGPFFAGWNYVLGTEPSDGAWFVEAATLLGEACALPLPPRYHLLCLRTPIRFEHPLTHWRLDESHLDAARSARVVEALLASRHALRRGHTEFVVGLHAHEFGWVHTGVLRLFFDGRLQDASAELVASGERNPLTEERRTGPYAASIYMERPEPVPLPALRWPFAER